MDQELESKIIYETILEALPTLEDVDGLSVQTSLTTTFNTLFKQIRGRLS